MGKSAILKETTQQLDAYFQGKLYHFDLPLKPASTPKGEAMRQAIMNIAYGSTASYRQVAMGIDSGARAIGQSCARNPFTLIVPCHRVVKADGSLGQYSSGNGVSTKCWLLDHEKRYRPA
ncbi:MAG: methylated-DNA--[protein]-cysteine S-methyltransferase [Zymomonas mobilis subsp. pomaceae]